MLDNSPAPKLAYGIADFARAVGVSRDKVYSEIRDGRLQAHKIGSRSVITADAARQYLASLPPLESAA
jgi:excisionase family DNA binding protein